MSRFPIPEILAKMSLKELKTEFAEFELFVKTYSKITKLKGRIAYLGAFQIMSKFADQKWYLFE